MREETMKDIIYGLSLIKWSPYIRRAVIDVLKTEFPNSDFTDALNEFISSIKSESAKDLLDRKR